MAILKPKGKHAQGAHAQAPVSPSEENGELNDETENAGETAPAEDAAEPSSPESAGEAAPSVPSLPEIIVPAKTEAPDAGTLGSAGDAAEASAPESAAYPPSGYPSNGFAPVTSDGIVLHKKRRAGKVVGITFGIIIAVLLVVYIGGAILFMGRFFPQTTIIGKDVSMMSNGDVAAMLENAVDSYAIDVAGNGFTYRTTGKNIDLSIDSEQVVNAIHAKLSPWAWPVMLIEGAHDGTDAVSVSFNKQGYEPEVTSALDAYNKDAVAPVNATIAYDDKTKKFSVVAEVPGTQYETRSILAAMSDTISALEPNLKLTNDFLVQPTVKSTDERLVNSAELATGLVSANIKLTMNGQPAVEINGSNLSQFIHVDENYGVTLDDAAIDQWVIDVSNGFDTIGSERTYTRADGKVITVSGGSYGWSTDALALKDEIVAAIKAGETKTIDIPCQETAAVYNGPGQRDWGNRYIDVDISEQFVRFYGDDGNIIWEAACISGSPDGSHDTGRGVWYVNDKQSPSKLIGYENGVKIYETTVTYWMAFESSDIGFHDATWQPGFGGDMYASGYGSHGCVNLSYSDAESLYDIVAVGDCVVVHD